MQRDLRSHPRYAAARAFFAEQIEPALGVPSDALEVHESARDGELAIAAIVHVSVDGMPVQRIGLVQGGAAFPAPVSAIRLLESEGDDLAPRWSPDGATLAFISDRVQRGRFELFTYAQATGDVARHGVLPEASIESLAWSPDGARLLLQTVGLGADRAGAAGSGTLEAEVDGPAWLPVVEESVPDNLWRRLWSYAPGTGTLTEIGPPGLTVWEAAWCSDRAAVAVVSDNPREGAWHGARLVRIDGASLAVTELFASRYEMGLPVATPDGRYVGIVEASCSDRTIVAGDVRLLDAGAVAREVDTNGVDVTWLGATSAGTLVYAGLRGLETVVGEIDCATGVAREQYRTRETFGRRYPSVSVARGAYATVVHSFARPPAVVRIEKGVERVAIDLAHAGNARVLASGAIEAVRWSGRDGLAIDGLLVVPHGPGPHPLVVMVHGGPVWAFTDAWQMYYRLAPFLADNGYAVLHPNPRGSGGRGQTFARMVRGDMNGEDTFDIIAGVEMLVARGIADPARLAVTGRSYGGMMSSWIITQTDLFAASIPVSPVTDMVSQHFTSNIPNFDAEFFASDPTEAAGKHVLRSAIRYAKNVKTPTLNIAGALDRCTPPTQALEFHRALVEQGVPSELVIYPLEGHGVKQFEAFVDYCTRILLWLERYAPARVAGSAPASAEAALASGG